MLLILLLSTAIAQSAQLCSKPVEYSSCTTDAHKQMASCSAKVVGNPTATYYRCLCEGQNALVSCYSICGDDPNLQLQLPTAQRDAASSCKVATEQEAKAPKATTKSTTSSDIKTTLSSSPTVTSTINTESLIKTATNQVPASPTKTGKPATGGGIVFSAAIVSQSSFYSLFLLLL